MCGSEVAVTTLRPPRLCRLAVFSIIHFTSPTPFMSHRGTLSKNHRFSLFTSMVNPSSHAGLRQKDQDRKSSPNPAPQRVQWLVFNEPNPTWSCPSDKIGIASKRSPPTTQEWLWFFENPSGHEGVLVSAIKWSNAQMPVMREREK